MRCAVSLLILPLMALAQAPHAGAEAGRTLFLKMCSGCHGDNAKGGRGSDLTTGNWKWGGSDSEIAQNILKGIAGTQMPAFPIAESEAREIVGYLRTLSGGGAEERITGDAAAGRKIFAARCAGCHMFRGKGGRLGPDLTAIREERKAAELRESIAEPDKKLRPGFQTVEVKLKNGQALRGARRNEDTFSIQLMDEKEKLHFLLKRDVASSNRPAKSLMPKMSLAAGEIEDLVAFLKKDDSAPDAAEWRPAGDFNVTFARLKNAAKEPQNWLTYWGDYQGRHASALAQITPANVGRLKSTWAYQFGAERNETTPIVVDGMMFVTGPGHDVAALDARTGRSVWRYRRRVPDDVHSYCTVMTNRGVAVLGDRLYLATLDAKLVALDAKTGNRIWETAVDDYRTGYSITHAPLALDGKIIVGVTAGECGNNGFVDAYDAASGKKLWRVWAIAQPGDPARSSWSGKSAETGGGPTWMTGTYDAETDTLFWATGNPGPDYDGTVRLGDNLYTCSVLAIDPNSGKLKWYFQFTPHDVHDWDATETPTLADVTVRGQVRKALIQANRNGFFYVLDRTTGEFLLGKAFVKQTWAKGLDDKGRPIVIPNTDPTPEGNFACPDAAGGANWAAPSFDARSGLYFVAVREACAIYTSKSKEPIPGQPYTGSGQQEDPLAGEPGAVRAIDPGTGSIKWSFPLHIGNVAAGVLHTAGGVLFAASADGYLIALDPRTGKDLWRYQTGAEIRNSPISYSVDGKQYVAIGSATTLFVFGLD